MTSRRPPVCEHAPRLGQQPRGVGDVLEHLRAPHEVDARVLERDRAVGAERAQVGAGHVAARALERALGELDADGVGARVAQGGDEAAGAAAEVEHALAGAGLAEQQRAAALAGPRLGVLGQLGPDVLVVGLHTWREARRTGYRLSDDAGLLRLTPRGGSAWHRALHALPARRAARRRRCPRRRDRRGPPAAPRRRPLPRAVDERRAAAPARADGGDRPRPRQPEARGPHAAGGAARRHAQARDRARRAADLPDARGRRGRRGADAGRPRRTSR